MSRITLPDARWLFLLFWFNYWTLARRVWVAFPKEHTMCGLSLACVINLFLTRNARARQHTFVCKTFFDFFTRLMYVNSLTVERCCYYNRSTCSSPVVGFNVMGKYLFSFFSWFFLKRRRVRHFWKTILEENFFRDRGKACCAGCQHRTGQTAVLSAPRHTLLNASRFGLDSIQSRKSVACVCDLWVSLSWKKK